jgi:hypothetical protein
MTRQRRGPYRPRRPVTIPAGYSPLSIVGLRVAAEVVGMSPRGFEKLLARGDGPDPNPDPRVWRSTRLWRVWRLVAWSNTVRGDGPTTLQGIGNAWLAGAFGEVTLVRYSDPRRRPSYWERGEKKWQAKVRLRRQMRHIMTQLARLDYQMKITEIEEQIGSKIDDFMCSNH